MASSNEAVAHDTWSKGAAAAPAFDASTLRSVFQDVVREVVATELPSLMQPALQEMQAQLQRQMQDRPRYTAKKVTRNYAANAREQEFLRANGQHTSLEPQVFEAAGPMDMTSYVENKLPREQHYAVPHFKVQFCAEVKRRRLLQYEREGRRFWVEWRCSEYRLAYTEVDRELVDEVWAEEETQQYLRRQLECHRPATTAVKTRGDRPARYRRGPYARPASGGSQHVSRASIDRFFNASRGSS
jgi:hypothetical protein